MRVLLLAALASAGCGSAGGAAATQCAHTPPPVPRIARGPVTVTADQAVVPAGGNVSFTVVVRGPDSFSAQCPAPVQLLVEDDTSLRVYAGSAATGPAAPCGTVVLAPGNRAVYTAVWPVDPSLPGGIYVAHIVLGDQPDYVVRIQVGAAIGTCAV
jgi:hypothetical protein